MKGVAILGATGSIGVQTLDIIAQHPDRLRVVGLAAAKSGERLLELAAPHGNPRVALFDEAQAERHGVSGGMDAIVDLACAPDVDIVVVAVAGVIGLLPTLAAIRAGKQIALASKEVLVAAGELVMPLVREHGALMTPIDSEHSAVFQCLQGAPAGALADVILTASGGPFRGRTRADLERVTVEDALNHPTWRMGGKITVDSATLMNKALETIEARWLFDVPIENVQVVVHPQSIIHSMVRFKDGSVLAQMGWPDMRLPIQYALLYPERPSNGMRPWNPVETPGLTFEAVDEQTFPSLQLAKQAMGAGGTMPCAFNAANEEAANLFLAGRLAFLRIFDAVEHAMARHEPTEATLENVIASDAQARQAVRSLL